MPTLLFCFGHFHCTPPVCERCRSRSPYPRIFRGRRILRRLYFCRKQSRVCDPFDVPIIAETILKLQVSKWTLFGICAHFRPILFHFFLHLVQELTPNFGEFRNKFCNIFVTILPHLFRFGETSFYGGKKCRFSSFSGHGGGLFRRVLGSPTRGAVEPKARLRGYMGESLLGKLLLSVSESRGSTSDEAASLSNLSVIPSGCHLP